MSNFRQALDEYLTTSRALGSKQKWAAQALPNFVAFLDREGAAFITTDLAVRWATTPVGVQAETWARRLSVARRFAVWIWATDARTEIPPQRLLPAGHRRKTPHIYSDQEILDLMTAARGLHSASGLRAQTYRTLVGLLAACGLRPGEALALDEADVDLQAGILSVRLTKFGKSRFVPVEPTTCRALRHYALLRDRLCPQRQSQAFLVSEQGQRLLSCAAQRTFATLTRSIGLRPSASRARSGRGPRLQDLRHTFATKRLIEWYRAGLDVSRMMPGLSTYLGHSGVSCTYWYIQAVPELLQLATERLTAGTVGGAR
jgi:site-specific recombinase XerD